jgi:hypothetical protein
VHGWRSSTAATRGGRGALVSFPLGPVDRGRDLHPGVPGVRVLADDGRVPGHPVRRDDRTGLGDRRDHPQAQGTLRSAASVVAAAVHPVITAVGAAISGNPEVL